MDSALESGQGSNRPIPVILAGGDAPETGRPACRQKADMTGFDPKATFERPGMRRSFARRSPPVVLRSNNYPDDT